MKPSENPANPHRPAWKLITDIGKDFAHFPSPDMLVWLGTGGALALASHPLDDDVNARLASVTFASTTVLQRHLGWRAALPTYTMASYVAISRLRENRHFLSDVMFGAALDIASGRTVTRHGRDSWVMLPASVPRGAEIVVARVQ